jgi:pimeloyl-ACP methyl ester carboxylesterase
MVPKEKHMETQSRSSLFKTEKDASEYLAEYAEFLKAWPIKPDAVEIETDLGITHLNCVGLARNPPVLLLPGSSANSLTWFSNIESLSKFNRVLAVDPPGHPGLSIARGVLNETTVNPWLLQLLAKLSIQKVRLVGWSLGGWAALNFAIKHPERTERIALLDPGASFVPYNKELLWRTLTSMVLPNQKKLVAYFKWMLQGNVISQQYGHLTVSGILRSRPQPLIRMRPFSDEQLRACNIPALLLVPEKTVLYKVQDVVGRVSRLMPSTKIEIVPGASHVLHIDRPEAVNSSLKAFLQ